MSTDAIEDELTSINAIFDEETLSPIDAMPGYSVYDCHPFHPLSYGSNFLQTIQMPRPRFLGPKALGTMCQKVWEAEQWMW